MEERRHERDLLTSPSFMFAADDSTLVGYSPRSSQTERDWETKLRAIPDPVKRSDEFLSFHGVYPVNEQMVCRVTKLSTPH